MNLKQKIIEVRKEVSFLQKNTNAYNYKYVTEDQVLFAIKDKMDELGLLLVPSVTNHDVTPFAYKNKYDKDVIENIVHGDITFTWYDSESESGEELAVPFALYGQQQDAAQAFGSALTYSNRYFLLKFFQVATNENDPDAVRSKINKKADKEFDAMKQTKKNLLDKTYAECTVNGQLDKTLHTSLMRKTLAEFGYENWKSYNPNDVSELAFIKMFQQFWSDEKLPSNI